MIPIKMIVVDEFRDRPSEMALAQRDHAIEALVFNRADEALRVRIRVRRLKRRTSTSRTGILDVSPCL
jgi:hypothetical protein